MKAMSAFVVLVACQLSAHADDGIPKGRLGHPLGTYFKIEGVRAEAGKVGTQTLLVDAINGERIDQPIGIWIDNVSSLPKGERCMIKGYESGKMIGTVLGELSIIGHLSNLVKGVIDTKDIVYYVLFIFTSVFLTLRVLESKRWRG